ncbi:hypothetical protein ACOKM5_43500 [Streptomyces sp. BH097]|uniref:hypothetical protein n=1 Tax=unclassified Streptomyces TaxID=2593676 RepID=UPI003BB4F815
MTPNTFAHAWQTLLRATVNDESLWLAGHNALSAGGLTHLVLAPSRVNATATDRHHTTPAHPVITMPVLNDTQATAWQTASPTCSHHQALHTGDLLACLRDPAHTGGVPTQPTQEEISFHCDCGSVPCQHVAALAHSVAARLTTSPADFAMLRGLPTAPPRGGTAARTAEPVVTTRTSPGGRVHIPAQHAWAWYRECAEPPLISPYVPETAAEPAPPIPAVAAPPAPAPGPEQIQALISDAAARARAHLQSAMPLECALHEDALRLAATVPGVRLPDIAERLAIDIADLREQVSATTARADSA